MSARKGVDRARGPATRQSDVKRGLRVELNREISDKLRDAHVAKFERTGRSVHSGSADTLPILINYCEEKKIPYRLLAHPGAGYFIERIVG